jgi:hypothetical protein
MTKVLGLHLTKVFTFRRRKLQATKKPSLRTSALSSVVEEGAANSSPEVDGGTGSSAAGGGTADVAEDAEGEIVVTNVGANFFAFSKNTFISSRVWP